ncbi:cyclodeaminase [Fictibacillus enclensis]|uniref:cyclodeaminase n=1 Tax=Fictibacillus enclensis TaxID=1017270 RepID=UPI0025A2097A|nr:cyclodeaminase [Fictibacillus enclensis]MDM5337249.1 cyclodeaminase [Fictibacillus enclensis]
MYIFTEQELRQHISLNHEALSVVEDGFSSLAEKKAVMPPIMRVDVHDHNGEVDVKTAYIKGKDKFAIKVSSGFFNNYQLGLPSGSGLMMLVSATTGVPEALLLDNGYLTDVRTAAAGAIASKYMAKEDIHTVSVIGCGSQARYQVKALQLVRNFKRVLVYGRSSDRVEAYVKEMTEELGVEVQAAESAKEAVIQSDLVITTTPASEPVIKAEWLHPGLHITAMGSDAEHKQEIEADVLAKADVLVCDTVAQCERLGELHHALSQGVISETRSITEIGELTSRHVAGRQNDEQITVCDLTGTGVQDTAIALFAFQEMVNRGLGLKIENKKPALKN